MTNKERRGIWAKHFEAHKASKQSIINWCKDNNVNVRQFYKWRRRLLSSTNKTPSATNHFIQAKMKPPIIPVNDLRLNCAAIIIKIGTAVIEVQQGFDEEALASVFRAVAKGC